MNKIFKGTAFLFGLLALGCQTTEVLEQENSESHSQFSEITFTDISKLGKYEFDVTSSTQRLSNETINSPVIGVNLPKSESGFSISISSEINKSAFAPNIVFLDDEWKPVESVDFAEFEYQRPDTYKGDALTYKFEVNSIEHREFSHMVLYTTPENLQSYSHAIHPARLKAEMRDEVLDIDDIKVKHSEYGEISITLDSVVLDSEEAKQERQERAKSADYYFSEINKYVSEGDIEEALRIRDEAKFYGIEGADEAFAKALQQNQ
ncbi:MalM family protein [Vibrio breoganii]